jgi:hydroxyethylthiazole kinase
LSAEDFAALQAHIGALAFWPGGMGLPDAHWHFQPREFVRWFRACGWIGLDELTQLLPRRHGPSAAQLAEIPWARAQARFRPYAVALSRAFRKYLILSPERQTHFLAQTYIETAMWATMEEYGRAQQQRRRDGTMYWPAPAMQYYQAFYGRGIMQLTWAANYEAYGIYRQFANVGAGHIYADARINHASMHYWSDPRDRNGRIVQTPRRWSPRFDPAQIATEAFNACDSGAFYWVSKNVGGGAVNINRTSDDGVTQAAVGRASVLVNGGGYGFAERQAYAPFIERFRGESTETTANSSFNVTYGRRVHAIYVDFTPQRPR